MRLHTHSIHAYCVTLYPKKLVIKRKGRQESRKSDKQADKQKIKQKTNKATKASNKQTHTHLNYLINNSICIAVYHALKFFLSTLERLFISVVPLWKHQTVQHQSIQQVLPATSLPHLLLSLSQHTLEMLATCLHYYPCYPSLRIQVILTRSKRHYQDYYYDFKRMHYCVSVLFWMLKI